MKNGSRALGWLLSTILVAGGISVLASVYTISAQSLCANGRSVGPCETLDQKFPGNVAQDKGFELGRSLALCFVLNCPIYTGAIKSVDVDNEKRIVHMSFHVGERLSSKTGDDPSDLEFDILWSLQEGRFAFDVRLEQGSQLIIGKLGYGTDVLFLLGNANYFSSVRSTIAFSNANYSIDVSHPRSRTQSDNLEDIFPSFPGQLHDQTDNVFAGYVAGFAYRVRPLKNLDQNIRALCELMSDLSFPTQGLEQIGQGIYPFLQRESGLSEENTDAVIKMLVRFAAGSDRVRASEALRLIGFLFIDDRLPLERYFDKSSARKVIQNIRDLKFDSTAHMDQFSKKLQKIN